MENNIFDFLAEQSNAAGAGHNLVLLAFALSFILASMIVLTYQISTPSLRQSLHFMQSLILLTIVAATIMQAIGDSIARGLGILGALAIIRFRTNVRDPRNITFTFASLAAGLACGMYGFVVAIVGTTAFCLAAILLKFSHFGRKAGLTGALKFESIHADDVSGAVERALKRFCSSFEQVEITLLNTGHHVSPDPVFQKRLAYSIVLKQRSDSFDLSKALSEIEGIGAVNLKFTKRRDEI